MGEYLGWIIGGGIAVLLVLILIGMASTYNKLVRARNKVRDQWSQIDVQLKRRFDLIPNLVECVKGYTQHESATLEKVIAARNKMRDAHNPRESMEANAGLSAALPAIFALGEAYPELKANTNFAALQQELSETESKIAYARQFYNDTVMLYKNAIETFPNNIFAGLFGFKSEEFFSAVDDERQSVGVKF